MQVLEAASPSNVRLAIRPDPYCETDKRAHFQLSSCTAHMDMTTGALVSERRSVEHSMLALSGSMHECTYAPMHVGTLSDPPCRTAAVLLMMNHDCPCDTSLWY